MWGRMKSCAALATPPPWPGPEGSPNRPQVCNLPHKLFTTPQFIISRVLILVIAAAALQAADSTWLESVAPIMTAQEKKTYLSLKPAERVHFEEEFWKEKPIAAEEYFERLQYIDANFGSGKLGSGANTDQGRVYLALGPPTNVSRHPSSRIFVPLEIWYYDTVPALNLKTELRLIFFQKNLTGFPKLYSPQMDTIRALFVPESATTEMFGPNDEITEAGIRNNLSVSPVEDEIVRASVNVATGIRDVGNEEILGKVSSPAVMLGSKRPDDLRTDVKSRLIVTHPKLDILQTASPYGGSQVDLALDTPVRHELDVVVSQGPITVHQNQLRLKFERAEDVCYTHRVDLLPGSYRIVFTIDGAAHPYTLDVPDRAAMGEIWRADASDVYGRQTPFEFDGRQLNLKPDGKLAVVALAHPGKVNWTIRKGLQIMWRSSSDARELAIVELPTTGFPPGAYNLEAAAETESRTVSFVVEEEKRAAPRPGVVSLNANLSPALRWASIGHQWLLRGNLEQARRSLEESLSRASTREGNIEMARLEASSGQYDEARDRLNSILTAQPKDFDAISVLAYVEAKLQDYPVARELYRRALAIQDSPAIRLALSSLPQ
jgi:GWxTD domain-containing protein